MNQPLEQINPNLGWVIGPIALTTGWLQANLVHVDLSWAELLYSVAAVMYAVAAIIKSLKERNSKDQLTPQKTSQNSELNGDTEDTIDVP